jgi:hypothetical protein
LPRARSADRLTSGAESWLATAGLFLVAWLARILFLRAAPDASWPHSIAYKGDALLWLDHARCLDAGIPFEFSLPLRPPGTAYLLSWLWDGTAEGIARLKLVWTAMGAATVALLHRTWLASFGPRVAGLAAGAAALSGGLMIVSGSLNNETPYLLAATAAVALTHPLACRPRPLSLALWALAHAIACLIRVEHGLFFALSLAFLMVAWRTLALPERMKALGTASLVFALALLPWQMHAISRTAAFNRGDLGQSQAAQASIERIEQRTRALTWDRAAVARREELPAFTRRSAAAFVAATLQHRGEAHVRAEDFEILAEAFGSLPRPLRPPLFVASYGGLNFYLANHDGAQGGFQRGPLDAPPPLEGGSARYPPDLIAGLPPPSLAFEYPPHLQAFNEGYRLGLKWIAASPGDFLKLLARKLAIFWSGATPTFTGFGLPLGMSGPRRPVDVVVPETDALASIWRVGFAVCCILGIWSALPRREAIPWLLFLFSKGAVAAAFFGYARAGVVVQPALMLFAAIALQRWWPARRWLGTAILLGALALEAARCARGARVEMDGKRVGAVDPEPAEEHGEHFLRWRW